jgi:hypothetical protein
MKRRAAQNSGLAKGGLTCFVETFVQGSAYVFVLTLMLKIPPFAKPLNVNDISF